MPAVANIVLADAQGTPVNHTFIPLGPDASGVWWFEDQSSSTPIGYWRLSIQLKRPGPPAAGQSSSTERVSRATLTMHQPVLETLGSNDAGITPPPTVSYIPRCKQEFILPERGTLQNRKDLRKMSASLLSDTTVLAVVENLQNLY